MITIKKNLPGRPQHILNYSRNASCLGEVTIFFSGSDRTPPMFGISLPPPPWANPNKISFFWKQPVSPIRRNFFFQDKCGDFILDPANPGDFFLRPHMEVRTIILGKPRWGQVLQSGKIGGDNRCLFRFTPPPPIPGVLLSSRHPVQQPALFLVLEELTHTSVPKTSVIDSYSFSIV